MPRKRTFSCGSMSEIFKRKWDADSLGEEVKRDNYKKEKYGGGRRNR